MNLREFTEAVDSKAKEMSKENLQMALHSLARKVPEQQRTEFMRIMDGVHKDQESKEKEGNFKVNIVSSRFFEIYNWKKYYH